MRNGKDTIAAVATAVGGGIGVVRISGSRADEIVRKVFRPQRDVFESHKLYYGTVRDGDRVVDEVLVTVMYAPKSYTKENVAEIHCHGGVQPLKQVLALVLKEGAKLAEPGEFTKRAFLNGRIDLSQAEAVADVIGAKSEISHRAAVAQLGGRLGKQVREIMSLIMGCLASIEAAIDYPEHELENDGEIERDLNGILEKIEEILKSSEMGRLVREGIETVITGKPNVGKSSLLNALLREERAIVTEIPGTTRDTLTEYVNLQGVLLRITDTAGIRATDDVIEKIGVERSVKALESAELVIAVFDGTRELEEPDFEIIERVRGKKVIALINKSDLRGSRGGFSRLREIGSLIEVSAKELTGLDRLTQVVQDMFFSGRLDAENVDIAINARHKEALTGAADGLKNALETAQLGLPEDLIAVGLQDAYRCLCEITGDNMSEDLLDRIFSEFCLGK